MVGMNQEEKEYMVCFILDVQDVLGLMVLIIEYYMDVVIVLCDWVLVLNNGQQIVQGFVCEVIVDLCVVEVYIGKFCDVV